MLFSLDQENFFQEIKSFYISYFTNQKGQCSYHVPLEDSEKALSFPKSQMGDLRFKIPPSVYDIKENKKENSITKILENIVARSIQVLKAAIGPCSSFRDDDFSALGERIELLNSRNKEDSDGSEVLGVMEEYSKKLKMTSLKARVLKELFQIQESFAEMDHLLCVSVNTLKILVFNNLCLFYFIFTMFNMAIIVIMNQFPIIPFSLAFVLQSGFVLVYKKIYGSFSGIKDQMWTLMSLEHLKIKPEIVSNQRPRYKKPVKRKKKVTFR